MFVEYVTPARMVGESEPMLEVLKSISDHAATDMPVLITGETGTGKGLVVEEIHRQNGREGNLVEINCGAFSDTLAESIIFGHDQGDCTDSGDDIAILARAFCAEASRNVGRQVTDLGEPVIRALKACNWPGNVRELRNLIVDIVVKKNEGTENELSDIRDEPQFVDPGE